MEKDLGLDKLSEDERILIYALSVMSPDGNGVVRSVELKRHPLCRKFSNPTFYRTLRALLDKGFVSRAGPRRTGADLRPDFPPALGRIRRLITGLMRPWFPVSISLQTPAA
ncbi:hypothetical protein [Roseovarius salinarum]|uniref:hypothetical protein n=1 Tax=Roseovarius salinarum TaxID=1981892 RepID=UPI0012FFEB4D|nr:hypothetical protein [Roseovarius salinarum]